MNSPLPNLDLLALPLAQAADALRIVARSNLDRVLSRDKKTAPNTAGDSLRGHPEARAGLSRLLELERKHSSQSRSLQDHWYGLVRGVLTLKTPEEKENLIEVGTKVTRTSEKDEFEYTVSSVDDLPNDRIVIGGDSVKNKTVKASDCLVVQPAIKQQELGAPVHTGLMLAIRHLKEIAQASHASSSDPVARAPSDDETSAGSRAPSLWSRFEQWVGSVCGAFLGYFRKRRAVQITAGPALAEWESVPREPEPATTLPQSLWVYLSALGLGEPQFVGECCRTLRDHLLTRYVTVLEEDEEAAGAVHLPLPILHANTHWALLLIVPFDATDEGPSIENMPRLLEEAEERVREHGWAGFWDQWVICEAFDAFPGDSAADAAVLSDLRSLPWIACEGDPSRLEGLQPDTGLTEPTMAEENWDDRRPSWIDPRHDLQRRITKSEMHHVQ